MNNENKAIGSFIGLAVGDALGAPVEFRDKGSFKKITDYQSGGTWNLPIGYWTDDTSMAICLAKSILETITLDHTNLLGYFSRWMQDGENSSTGQCFDVGNTTAYAIRHFITEQKYTPARNLPQLSGNGSIMRLAPVAIRWHHDRATLESFCKEQSITTHGSDECVECSIELGNLIADAINNIDIMTELKAFAWRQHNLPNSGRALDTMIAAKWAVGSTTNFDDAVLAAVNLGGDADTIAAVAGQIAGAIYGLHAIRSDWVTRLHQSDMLIGLAKDLYSKSV
jgi:ADP-ribosyl-[dinitrogen reductase] hydrolase